MDAVDQRERLMGRCRRDDGGEAGGAHDDSEALAACEQLLADEPDHAAVWRFKGHALRGLGREEEAGAAYRRAIGIEASAAGLLDLGGLLDHRGQPDAALEVYRRAAALAPGDPGPWVLQVDVLARLAAGGAAGPVEPGSPGVRAGG